jgi:hypothetical protein
MPLEALQLIPCDDVTPDPANYHRLTVVGLLSVIRSRAAPPFPVVQPIFCVLLVVTGGQGAGELELRITQDVSGNQILRTRRRQVRFAGDPAAILPVKFEIRNCSFPAAGIYWVEAVWDGAILARRKLFLRVWIAMNNPDPTIPISCDEELVTFSDDANSPPMQAEIVTIPPTGDIAGSPPSGQPFST